MINAAPGHRAINWVSLCFSELGVGLPQNGSSPNTAAQGVWPPAVVGATAPPKKAPQVRAHSAPAIHTPSKPCAGVPYTRSV